MRVLDKNLFKIIVENTPLVSLDLCLIFDGKILLGQRNNEPLKGSWFTPGGRILKNESLHNCLCRVALTELGLRIDDRLTFELMGAWDHFYPNSAVDKNISTHYVNLPYYAYFDTKPKISVDDQHAVLKWFDLKEVINSDQFHTYTINYAYWLSEKGKYL